MRNYEECGTSDTEPRGTVRLVRNGVFSHTYSSGIVQIYYSASSSSILSWGNICDDTSFGDNEANVICNQLAYNGASVYGRAGSTSSFGIDYNATILDDVSCSSSSFLTLEQCSLTTIISITCSLNSNDAFVTCYTIRIWNNPYPGQIRLQGSIYTSYGRLEVYCNGQWGTVCDDTFGAADAKVVCRQLGYSHYVLAHSGTLLAGSSFQPIWLDRVFCSSSYSCLASCESCPSSQYHNCFHSEDVAIACEFDSTETASSNTLNTCQYSSTTGTTPTTPTTATTDTTTATTDASTCATTNISPDIVGIIVGVVAVVGTTVTCTPQFTNCPSSVCLSQPVSYECTADTTDGATALNWRVLDTNNDPITGAVTYNKGQALPATSPISSDFTTNLTASSGPIVSDISFTPSVSISNYTVECRAGGPFGYTPVTCIILIAGIPASAANNNLTFTLTNVIFSSSPSTSPCVSHYNVNVTSIEYTINTNDTSLSLPVPSTNDTEYSISVVAVDTGVPLSVDNLMLTQTYYPTDTNGIANITASWNPPLSSSYPTLLQYHISYSELQDVTIILPNDTSQTLSGFTVGSVYTVGVAAITSAISTSARPSTIATSMLVSDITTMQNTLQSTTTFTRGCNSVSSTTVPIAVSVSVTFILTAILSSTLTLILTLLCVRSRSNKPVEQVKPVEWVERDEGGATASFAVYDEITTTKGGATSSVPLTSNPAYGPLRN
uniref:SRCR domain-containing protein n=1 Tax=Amphimedon queenslandica TaxID=400682 RepID=A0A1X7TIM3_AMPQE